VAGTGTLSPELNFEGPRMALNLSDSELFSALELLQRGPRASIRQL
jgi:hypothetical protein